MAKKKKSWKKKLGKALMAGAALAGGLALAKNRNRNAMIKGADANEGFGAMTLKDYGPHRNSIDDKVASTVPNWINTEDPHQYRWPTGSWGKAYKKGGRVTGAAKRGFGRALMKGKK